MNDLNITTAQNATMFEPGAALDGEVSWLLQTVPEAIELRLFWHTSGKGTTDVEVVEVRRFDSPGLRQQHTFHFVLPEGPYSFSGRLISLSWALELVVLPSGPSQRLPLVVAPGRAEIELHAVPVSTNP